MAQSPARSCYPDSPTRAVPDVYIPGTTYLAKTASDGSFTIDAVPPGTENLYVDHEGYVRGRMEGLAIQSGQKKDIGTMTLVQDTGASGFIQIDGGASSVTSLTVSLTLGASDSSILMMISENQTFLGGSWAPLQTSASYTFSTAGAKTLYVKFSDANGLERAPYSASVVVLTAHLSQVSLTGQPSDLRNRDTEVLVNGKVFIWGGWDVALNQVVDTGYLVDPKAGTFSTVTTNGAPSARYSHAAAVYGTKVMIWGGWDATGNGTATGAIYDTASGAWSSISQTGARPLQVEGDMGFRLEIRRFSGGGAAASSCSPCNNNVIGNSAGGVYDFTNDSWSSVTTTNAPSTLTFDSVIYSPSTEGAAVASTGTGVLIWGGCDGECTANGYLYDIGSDTWTLLPSAPIAARNSMASYWTGQKLIIWGGSNINGLQEDGAVYDLKSNSWTSISSTGAHRLGGLG